MADLRLGVLGSTRGSLLAPLVAELKRQKITAEIVVVVSDKADAGILQQARLLHIATEVVSLKGLSTAARDAVLADCLRACQVDVVVMLGFMRIVGKSFISHWPDKIINTHPSLLPKHAGLMDLAVHQSVLASGDTETGCSVHIVTADVDAGPILVQQRCPVLPDDTALSLKQRVQALEVPALASALSQFISQPQTIQDMP